jgi:hypothetical protein
VVKIIKNPLHVKFGTIPLLGFMFVFYRGGIQEEGGEEMREGGRFNQFRTYGFYFNCPIRFNQFGHP